MINRVCSGEEADYSIMSHEWWDNLSAIRGKKFRALCDIGRNSRGWYLIVTYKIKPYKHWNKIETNIYQIPRILLKEVLLKEILGRNYKKIYLNKNKLL